MAYQFLIVHSQQEKPQFLASFFLFGGTGMERVDPAKHFLVDLGLLLISRSGIVGFNSIARSLIL